MPRIAIACQGGGSHTAFTAGVLTGILEDRPNDYEIVALSGTSGGAICALLAWTGLREADEAAAVSRLKGFWEDIAATGPIERTANWGAVSISRTIGQVGSIESNPAWNPFSSFASRELRRAVRRHAGTIDRGPGSPRLFVGAVDVTSGDFEVFENGEGGVDAIAASAAIPTLFEAVEVGGHRYWDGLFSQNPPIRHFTDAPVEEKPEEIWIVRINPAGRSTVPTTPAEVVDRRNELAGNLSLAQEMHFIRTINRLLEEGSLSEERYRRIEIRVVDLGTDLDLASKLDRDPSFLRRLRRRGKGAASEFWT